MSHETSHYHLSPEALGTEPAGFDSATTTMPAAIAPALMSVHRLMQLAALRNDVRRKLAGYRQRNDQSAAILFQHLAYLRFDFILDEADELQASYNTLTARAEKAETEWDETARVLRYERQMRQQTEEALVKLVTLVQETHRWSAAVKKLEAERVALVAEKREAGRVDCPSCENSLAWDESWTGNDVCKYCGYPGEAATPPVAEGLRKNAQCDNCRSTDWDAMKPGLFCDQCADEDGQEELSQH